MNLDALQELAARLAPTAEQTCGWLSGMLAVLFGSWLARRAARRRGWLPGGVTWNMVAPLPPGPCRQTELALAAAARRERDEAVARAKKAETERDEARDGRAALPHGFVAEWLRAKAYVDALAADRDGWKARAEKAEVQRNAASKEADVLAVGLRGMRETEDQLKQMTAERDALAGRLCAAETRAERAEDARAAATARAGQAAPPHDCVAEWPMLKAAFEAVATDRDGWKARAEKAEAERDEARRGHTDYVAAVGRIIAERDAAVVQAREAQAETRKAAFERDVARNEAKILRAERRHAAAPSADGPAEERRDGGTATPCQKMTREQHLAAGKPGPVQGVRREDGAADLLSGEFCRNPCGSAEYPYCYWRFRDPDGVTETSPAAVVNWPGGSAPVSFDWNASGWTLNHGVWHRRAGQNAARLPGLSSWLKGDRRPDGTYPSDLAPGQYCRSAPGTASPLWYARTPDSLGIGSTRVVGGDDTATFHQPFGGKECQWRLEGGRWFSDPLVGPADAPEVAPSST